MTVEEAQIILSAFRDKIPEFLDPNNDDVKFVTGVQVVADANSEPLIQVALEHGRDQTELPDEVHKTSFEVTVGQDSLVVPVVYVNRSRAKPLGARPPGELTAEPELEIPAGTLAQGLPYGLRGTYGWGFVVNGDAYALSNWHILCPEGNDSPLTTRVKLQYYDVATLAFFEPMQDTGNVWDFAVAKLDDPNLLIGAFRENTARVKLPEDYPLELADSSLETGQWCYTVANKQPYYKWGRFTGVGAGSVEYDDGVERTFEAQLLFDAPLLMKGDSGCVAVHPDTTAVTGLFFAQDDANVLANPLYDRHWVVQDIHTMPGGTRLPEFNVDFELPS